MMFALPIVSGKYPDEVARVYHHRTKQSIRPKPARKTLFPKPGGLMGESAAKLVSLSFMDYLQAAPFCKCILYFLGRILFDSFMPKGSILRRVVKIREKNRL